MGSTFIDLTNKVIRRLNDIELTAATFGTATGFQAVVKDAVNSSIREINQREFQWPFNYSSKEETLVVDQLTYDLPADYKVIDWNTFFLKRDDTLAVAAQRLPYLEYDEWSARDRASDEQRDSGTISLPRAIYRTQDDKFGVTPPPDRLYVVKFEYWTIPTELDTDTDTTTIPSRFDNTIVSGAMWYTYMFRDNFEQAQIEERKFLQGIKNMRTQLINRFVYAWDTRSRDVVSRRNARWPK